MRSKLKFSLAAAAILMAGAAAGVLAARSVVKPPAGEVYSAGEVTVPTVFGQTAEEVLFYPWSLYDTQTLYPVPAEELLEAWDIALWDPDERTVYYHVATGTNLETTLTQRDMTASMVWGEIEPASEPAADPASEPATDPAAPAAAPTVIVTFEEMHESFLWMIVGNFSLLAPMELAPSDLADAMEWNVPPEEEESSIETLQLYLKDFPAAAYPQGRTLPAADVTCSFAFSEGSGRDYSLSFLLRPASPRTLTEEEQDAAMEKVDAELRQFFLSPDIFSTDLGSMLQTFLIYNQLPLYYDRGYSNLRLVVLDSLFDSWGRSGSGETGWYEDVDWPEELLDESLPLDDFLSGIESMGSLTVQLINTQSQIVVLFTLDSGQVLGAYYDIQLGCWSGVGSTE